jgi:hypothetical protein
VAANRGGAAVPARRAGVPAEPEPWRRALVAAAIGISAFTLLAVPTWLLIPYGTDGNDGWADLGYFALLLIILLVTPVIALATAFAAGIPVDRRTRELSTGRAVAWFAQLAAAPALIAAGIAMFTAPVAPWLPFVNLLLPAAGAGALARLWVGPVLCSRAGTMAVVLVTIVLASAPMLLFVLVRSGS